MRLKKCLTALAVSALFAGVAMSVEAQVFKKRVVPPREVPVGATTETTKAVVAAPHVAPSAVTRAVAVIHATKSGGETHGKITFTQTPHGVRVEGEVRGLKPGKHGFHIHEFGDCSSDDAMSAGGHFNPLMGKHAGPASPTRHAGDLGNIEADDDGRAKIDVTDPAFTFTGPMSILGRSVVVHEKEDDLKSQPAGNAGGRIGCGVIGIAKGS